MTTTEPPQTDRKTRNGAFVNHLRRLAPPDMSDETPQNRAALAALRRGLGKEPGTAPEMFPHVERFLPTGASPQTAAPYYIVAALFAWHPEDWNSSDPYTNLGASLARLRLEQAKDQGEERPTEGDSTERRFVAMLSSTRDDLPYHLRQMIGLLRTKEVPINWLQLLYDIQQWDDNQRRDRAYRNVQRRWASAFWGGTSVAEAPDASTSDTDQPTDTDSDTDEE